MFQSLVWGLLLIMSGTQTIENMGTKVVVRNTMMFGQVSETITYTMEDRRRVEMHSQSQHRNPDRTLEQRERVTVFITRCDLGQIFHLKLDAKEYSVSPYPPKPRTPEEMEARGIKLPSPEAKPNVRVETTTVDTDERKQFFGYEARHVIITTKQIPLDDSQLESNETVSDGWYIDFGRRLSCEPAPKQGVAHGYISSWAGPPGTRPQIKPEFVDIGPRETGFPVKIVRSSPGKKTYPDGRTETFTSTNESEVIELTEGPVDPALFEIPDDFNQVDR